MKLQLVLAIVCVTSTILVAARRKNLKATGEFDVEAHVPSLSLFIPPPRLMSIVTDALNATSGGDSLGKSLIVDPLLAVLNKEETQLLAMLLPHLFENKTTSTEKPTTTTTTTTTLPPTTTSLPPTLTQKPIIQNMILRNSSKTSSDRSGDPIINWLIHGSNSSDPPSLSLVTPGPMLSITEDMLISMLQQAIANFSETSPTTPTPPTTAEVVGPIGIGDDLLALLLKTLQSQNESSVSSDPIETLPTSTTKFTTTTRIPNFWPENVKPGGGISDEALAAIIKDVQDINNNVSTHSSLLSDDEIVTISSDDVVQLVHDVELAVNSSSEEGKPTTSDEEEKNTVKGKNKSKGSGTDKSKSKGKPSAGRGSSSSGNKKVKKKPGRRPSANRSPPRRANVWERLVKAASNAIFGENTKPKPGLFQIEDILDLLTNL